MKMDKWKSIFCCFLIIKTMIIIIMIRFLYSNFLGIQSALHIEGGNLLNHHQSAASIRMMQNQPYCARTPTTYQLISGEGTE